MAIDLSAANAVSAHFKIESGPHDSSLGKVLWAELGIEYRIGDIAPDIKITIPVAWDDTKPLSKVRSEAFAAFAKILKHAASCDLQELQNEPPAPDLSGLPEGS